MTPSPGLQISNTSDTGKRLPQGVNHLIKTSALQQLSMLIQPRPSQLIYLHLWEELHRPGKFETFWLWQNRLHLPSTVGEQLLFWFSLVFERTRQQENQQSTQDSLILCKIFHVFQWSHLFFWLVDESQPTQIIARITLAFVKIHLNPDQWNNIIVYCM